LLSVAFSVSYKFLAEFGDIMVARLNLHLAELVSVPKFQFNRIEAVFVEALDYNVGVSHI